MLSLPYVLKRYAETGEPYLGPRGHMRVTRALIDSIPRAPRTDRPLWMPNLGDLRDVRYMLVDDLEADEWELVDHDGAVLHRGTYSPDCADCTPAERPSTWRELGDTSTIVRCRGHAAVAYGIWTMLSPFGMYAATMPRGRFPRITSI